jgi:hypothetical protein
MIAAFYRDQVPSLCQALNIWNKQEWHPQKAADGTRLGHQIDLSHQGRRIGGSDDHKG